MSRIFLLLIKSYQFLLEKIKKTLYNLYGDDK